jgi:hypothetical protein
MAEGGDEGKDDEAKELENIHEHADPSRGDKEVDGGDRVSTEGDEPHGAADEQATVFKRSI